MSVKIIFSLPDELASRMRSVIPLSEIDSVIASLLEKEISIRETALYLTAKEVEEDTELRKEMALWEDSCVGDGLDEEEQDILSAFETGKLKTILHSKTEVTRLTRIFKAAGKRPDDGSDSAALPNQDPI